MFALEISFQDGVSQPEMILVRRPHALIGASDYAHVMIDDMRDLDYQLRITRDLGGRFECKSIGLSAQAEVPRSLDGVYEGPTSFNLGKLQLVVTPLDVDLLVREGEAPDRSGVRVMRQACLERAPQFPAIVIAGTPPLVVSVVPDQPIEIGRSKQCVIRLDSADVSARHARMGFERGEFWIEDLGSTNGTYLGGQQVSGRIALPPGSPVILGREISLFGVLSEDQIMRAARYRPTEEQIPAAVERRYPVVVSVSEVARPARVVVVPGAALSIGRDPSSDMWLGAPHVSRKHCSMIMSAAGTISVTDHSTNGTAYDGGILQKGDSLEISGTPRVLDFGGGVTVGICLDEAQERTFLSSHGALHAFQENGNSRLPTFIGPAAELGPKGATPLYEREERRERDFSLRWWQRVALAYEASGALARVVLFLALFCVLGLLLVILKLVVGLL